MSISSAMSNALSGLTAASRAAEVVSSNLANSMTDGYVRRELDLSAQSLGGSGAGVQVLGVTRQVDKALLADRRLADAQMGQAQTRSAFYTALEQIIGTPEDAQSLTAKMAQFEASLISASSQPDSQPRLETIVHGASALVSTLNEISQDIQDMRLAADTQIGVDVEQLNANLNKIADLNASILRYSASGQDAASLMDQRQVLIDQVAEVIPIKTVPRDHEQIAIYTTGGATLLDGPPSEIEFSSVGIMTPYQSLENGQLSGLTINGQPVNTSRENGPIGGGSLGALFEVRDVSGQAAQENVDAVARDLIERFEGTTVDPTASTGDPGLFTDDGAALDVTQELGLSARLSVSAAVDPDAGGDVTLLRDGLGATTAGAVGDSTQLQSWVDALSAARAPASGDLGTTARSASGLASDFLSLAGTARQSAESDLVHRHSQAQALKTMELRNGVDSDYELQQLLTVEQAYSANAKVIQAVDEMIQTLLGL